MKLMSLAIVLLTSWSPASAMSQSCANTAKAGSPTPAVLMDAAEAEAAAIRNVAIAFMTSRKLAQDTREHCTPINEKYSEILQTILSKLEVQEAVNRHVSMSLPERERAQLVAAEERMREKLRGTILSSKVHVRGSFAQIIPPSGERFLLYKTSDGWKLDPMSVFDLRNDPDRVLQAESELAAARSVLEDLKSGKIKPSIEVYAQMATRAHELVMQKSGSSPAKTLQEQRIPQEDPATSECREAVLEMMVALDASDVESLTALLLAPEAHQHRALKIAMQELDAKRDFDAMIHSTDTPAGVQLAAMWAEARVVYCNLVAQGTRFAIDGDSAVATLEDRKKQLSRSRVLRMTRIDGTWRFNASDILALDEKGMRFNAASSRIRRELIADMRAGRRPKNSETVAAYAKRIAKIQ